MTGWLRRTLRRWRVRRCGVHVQGEGGITGPRQRSECDVPTDRAVARTRATGGVPDPAAPDQHSSTGTTPTETFVGRVAGDDAWSGETGAETRAEAGRGPSSAGWRGRAEPVLGEIFPAASDAAAVHHLDLGPFVGGVADAVAVGELTSLEFDALQSVLTGVSARDVLGSGEGGLVRAASDTGPWLSRVRPRLVAALAGVDAAEVDRIADRWARQDEVEDVPAGTLAAVLGPLRELTRTAGDRGWHLYLWNTLRDTPGEP